MLNPASILLIPDQTRLAMALSVPRPKHQVSGRYTDLMPWCIKKERNFGKRAKTFLKSLLYNDVTAEVFLAVEF